MKKWILISLLIGGILFSFTESYQNHKIVSIQISSDKTIELSLKDKKRLEYFLSSLIIHDHFGYTLLGNKPISFGSYIKPFHSNQLSLIYQSLLPRNLKMYFGLKTWKKYRHLIPLKGFSIWEEENPWIKGGKCILIMNHKATNAIINKHKEFLPVIKKIKKQPLLSGVLQKHEGLIGILLGYGKKNAWLFWEKSKGKNVRVSKIWSNHQEKRMKQKLSLWNCLWKDDTISDTSYPEFMGNPDTQETKVLKENYRETRNRILGYYDKNDILEATLKILCKH